MHRLFHESMKHILQPVISAGKYGINMVDGKGNVRKVHPILACYVADYPEQCLVATVKYNTCPKCHTTLQEFGNGQLNKPRTSHETLEIIDHALESTKGTFKNICREFNLSGYIPDPFWSDLPFVDIHMSITPDILHQINSGVFSHLTKWCETIIVGTNELDKRVSQLPLSHGVQHFPGGFSILMRKSASEWKSMAKVLLGSIIGAIPRQAVKASRSLLDFVYLAQYTSHSDETLQYLDEALDIFHKEKQVFQEIWPEINFNLPKLHSLLHFSQSIRLFGATDNYNTEQFERLHIDFTKDAFRASNK